MILVLAGTKEGREIVGLLAKQNYQVIVAANTDYGREAAAEAGGEILPGELTAANFLGVIETQKVNIVIDASNPFATQVSAMLQDVCRQKAVHYLRYLRESTLLPKSPLIYPAGSWEEGAELAFQLGETIFLTTGSNKLEIFTQHPLAKGKRIVVRVLPDHKVVKKCQDLGLRPKEIVAMQGPFSKEMNRLMFKTYNASVVVIKESGQTGGTDTKIAAALGLKIPLVVITRPNNSQTGISTYEELLKMVHELQMG